MNPTTFGAEERAGAVILRLLASRLVANDEISQLEDELLEFVDETRPARLVIDFQRVTRCSTAVINGLLRTKKRLLEHGGKLALSGMRKVVRSAFGILNLEGTVFLIFDSDEEALDHLKELSS